MDDEDTTDTEPYGSMDVDARFERIEDVGMTQDILETDPLTVAVTEIETGKTFIVVPDQKLCTCDEPGPNLTCSHATYIVTQSGESWDEEATEVADKVIRAVSDLGDSIREERNRLSGKKAECKRQLETLNRMMWQLTDETPDPAEKYNIPDPDEV